MSAKKLAVFASGAGSNARNLMSVHSDAFEVACLVSDRKASGALAIAREHGVPDLYFSKEQWATGEDVVDQLERHHVDGIVLAGFLKLIPQSILQAYSGRIINIHPALLPKYGGKGMWGDNVHAAVIAAGELKSGITIHEVNERFDEGRILFQQDCPVKTDDTVETLRNRVQTLEHDCLPKFVENWSNSL